jgi:hypothetical protein
MAFFPALTEAVGRLANPCATSFTNSEESPPVFSVVVELTLDSSRPINSGEKHPLTSNENKETNEPK